MTKGFCFLMLLALLALPPAWAEELNIHGTVYQGACDPALWAETAAELRAKADGWQAAQLETLAQTYVCGKGESAQRKLLRAAPEMITVTNEDTGEERSSRLEPSVGEIKPLEGKAWDATVTSDYPDVLISVWTDEACVEGLGFRLVGGQWMIVRKDGACD